MAAEGPRPGTIAWRDLTVDDAESIAGFYAEVVGWKRDACDMGDYDDFNMVPPSADEPVAGVCHARGSNADVPAQWLIYIVVEDVDRSAEKCRQLGGAVLVGPRALAGGRFCVIRDPAGAVCALYRP